MKLKDLLLFGKRKKDEENNSEYNEMSDNNRDELSDENNEMSDNNDTSDDLSGSYNSNPTDESMDYFNVTSDFNNNAKSRLEDDLYGILTRQSTMSFLSEEDIEKALSTINLIFSFRGTFSAFPESPKVKWIKDKLNMEVFSRLALKRSYKGFANTKGSDYALQNIYRETKKKESFLSNFLSK